MITATELNKMSKQKKKDFCSAILSCADAWFAADPKREEAYREWLPKYQARKAAEGVMRNG